MEPLARDAVDDEPPAQSFHSFSHPDQAVARPYRACAPSVIAGFDRYFFGSCSHRDPESVGMGVTKGVGNDLLNASDDCQCALIVLRVIYVRYPSPKAKPKREGGVDLLGH